MSEIYLIRHGQASFGAENYDQLSEVGERQAEVLARFLETQAIGFDAIYTGSLMRQQDTAGPFCRRQEMVPRRLPALNEYDHTAIITARMRRAEKKGAPSANLGERLRTDMKAFQAWFDETVTRWMAGTYDDEPGVEPWPAFCSRVETGMRQIMAEQGRGRRLAVFTSGGPISVVVKAALGLSDRKTVDISWVVYNASITRLKYSGQALSLIGFNETSHLLIDGGQALITLR